MAMTLRPTDGLVSRLLQQSHSQTASPMPEASPTNKIDMVSISNQAQQKAEKQHSEQSELESQLLRLHARHQDTGGNLE